MSGKRGLSDDEIEVWTTVTRSIKPLKKPRRVVKAEPPATALPSRKIAAKAAISRPQPIPARDAPKPGAVAPKTAPKTVSLTRREKQRAARGHDAIDARLDLHGHTQSEAHAALLRFLRRASAGEMRLVLVITGKSGVLRQQVPHWLTTAEFRGMVISTGAAAITHGGDGALYIRVRRSRG
jgi:DNA-nicking Smr family endonuclease